MTAPSRPTPRATRGPAAWSRSTRITTSTRPSPTTRSAPWPRTSVAARERGLRTRPGRPRAPGTRLGAGLRGRGPASSGRRRVSGCWPGWKPRSWTGAGRLDLPAASGCGPGADRRSPVPRRRRPGPPQEMGEALEVRPGAATDVIDGLIAADCRRPGAGPPRRSWPTCSACCRRWGWTSRTSLPGAGPAGRATPARPGPGGRSTRSGVARHPHAAGLAAGGRAPGRQRGQPRLPRPSAVYAGVRRIPGAAFSRAGPG